MAEKTEVLFFSSSKLFRKWLQKNHSKLREQWVGYYKKASSKASITWPESVDQALCFGWIDGLRKTIDEESYKIRFTPRKPKSHWSKVNITRYKELEKLGLIMPSGKKAFKRMDKDNSENASYEQKEVRLEPKFISLFKKNEKAWKFFKSMSPSYQRTATWWVASAKREDTRERRLEILITDSQEGVKIKPLRR